MSSTSEIEIRNLAGEVARDLEALNLGEARNTVQEIIRIGWREAHARIETAYQIQEHIAALNIGKAIDCAKALAIASGERLLVAA